jgi:hypothetical protein
MRLTGFILVGTAGLFAISWWRDAASRKAKGILPLYLAGMLMDRNGGKASFRDTMQSFAYSWKLFVAMALTFYGGAFIFVGG